MALPAAPGGRLPTTDAAAQAAAPTTISRTVAAAVDTIKKTISTTGTLTPAVQQDVSFVASGTVTDVAVTAGQQVTAGQPLATVDTLTMQQTLADGEPHPGQGPGHAGQRPDRPDHRAGPR